MSAAEIISAVGPQAALRLSRSLGGKIIYVPQAPTPDNPIAQALGTEALSSLIAALGCGALYIPRSIYKRHRDERITRLVAKGASARRIARALRISARTVRHISRFERQGPGPAA